MVFNVNPFPGLSHLWALGGRRLATKNVPQVTVDPVTGATVRRLSKKQKQRAMEEKQRASVPRRPIPPLVTDPSSPAFVVPKVQIHCLPNNIHLTVSRTFPPAEKFPILHHIMFKLSSGLVGAKNAQKTAPKTSALLVDRLKERLDALSLGVVRLDFRGITSARAAIVMQMKRTGLQITEISDSTGIPHNGCRPKKSRRI